MRAMAVAVVAALGAASACGSVEKRPGDTDPDADPGGDDDDGADNGIDSDAAPPDAAAFGPVDVTFRFYGELVDAATILVYDADGALLLEETTGADGTRRLEDFPRGGGIYVGKFLGGAPRAASAFGVVPGDALILGQPGSDVSTTTINLSSSTAVGPIDHHVVGAGCNRLASPPTLPFDLAAANACRVDGAWTVVAIAYSAPTTPSQYAVMTNVTGAAPLVLDGFIDSFDLTSFRVAISNPLAGSTSSSVQFLFGWPIVGDAVQTFPTGSGNASWEYPAGVQPKLSYRVTSQIDSQASSSFDRTIDPIGAENVNMGQLLLPHMGEVTGDFSNTARPTLSWTADPAIVEAADMILIYANWDGPGYYEWSVALPVGQTSFQFPEIPKEHLDLSLPAGESWFFGASVVYIDAVDATFDELRQEPSRDYPGRSSARYFNFGPPL